MKKKTTVKRKKKALETIIFNKMPRFRNRNTGNVSFSEDEFDYLVSFVQDGFPVVIRRKDNGHDLQVDPSYLNKATCITLEDGTSIVLLPV